MVGLSALAAGVAPAITAAPAAAAAATVDVDCTGEDDSALQAALDDTAPDTEGGPTTEIVISGVCVGGFDVPPDATVHIRGVPAGAGADAILDDAIDGDGESRPLTAFGVAGLTLSNLIIQNGDASNELEGFPAGGGLLVFGDSTVVIDNVDFLDNDADGGAGGGAFILTGEMSETANRSAQALTGNERVTIRNSTFGAAGEGNVAAGTEGGFLNGVGGGLAVLTQFDVAIENTTFDSNRATTAGGGAAILAGALMHTELRGNTFKNNVLRREQGACSEAHLGGGLLMSSFFLFGPTVATSSQFGAFELDEAPEPPEDEYPTATQVGNTFSDNVIEPVYIDEEACGGGNEIEAAQFVAPPGTDTVGFAGGGGEWISDVWTSSLNDEFLNNTVSNTADNDELSEPVVGEAEGGGLAVEGDTDFTFYAENLVAAGNEVREAEGSGGGIYIGVQEPSAVLHLVNSTVSGNVVDTGVVGAGIGGGGSDDIVLENSIVWGNLEDEGETTSASDIENVATITATYSDVCGVEGTGNICADPKLVDAANGNVHQTEASPTRNAGSNALVPADLTTDYEGHVRIAESTVDMGADEFVPAPPPDKTLRPGDGVTPPGSIGLGDGYCLTAEDGGIFTFGGCRFLGAAATGPIIAPQTKKLLNAPMVGQAMHPDNSGYWMAAADGGVFTFGTSKFFGSMGGTKLNSPIVGIATSPTGNGYYLVAADGGVFTFGDAPFLGSRGGQRLNAPIANIVVTPSGKGYWLVASDGGVFSYGDARFFGSTGGRRLNAPIVGMASRPGGNGYWLVATDGGVFSFGDAPFLGSMGAVRLTKPIMAMKATSTGLGYYLVGNDGGVFTFGDAPFLGSMGGTRLNQPVVDMTG